MSGKDIYEIDEELSEEYLKGFFDGKEFEKSKQIKQRTFFASICILADKAKEVLEELEEWSRKEWTQ